MMVKMRFKRMFTTIDTHTCGDPTRTIIGGLPYIPGETIPEKMKYLQENADWIRTVLMWEPRGNAVQSGVILTEPCTPGADVGVIYIEVGAYLFMCGHDTIGVSTALIESGIVEPVEPYTYINLDTPASVVRVKVRVEGNVAKDVSFKNAPSFLYAQDIEISLPSIGKIKVDVSYGGLFYCMVNAKDVGLTPCRKEYKQIQKMAAIIIEAVNKAVDVRHPELDYIQGCTHVLFSAPSPKEGIDYTNAVVIPGGSVSRSPCGTGTCAKMAQLYARGRLKPGQEFIHEGSMTNTTFSGKIVEETTVGSLKAIVPEVSGRAYVTGMHTYVIDPDDPVWEGFLLV
jgi:proline racemase